MSKRYDEEVEVRVERDATGAVVATTVAAPQPLRIGEALPLEPMAACAGIEPGGILGTHHPPTLASDGGNPRVLIEVTPEALAQAAPDHAAFRRAVGALPALGGRLSLYLYRWEGPRHRARMFSPLAGTPEDAATGSAATPLAGFLLHLSGAESAALDIVQGVEMGRPSQLAIRAWRDGEGGLRAAVGGAVVPVSQGTILTDG